MKGILTVLIFTLFFPMILSSQENISWEVLADVIWEEELDTATNYSLMVGEFGEHLLTYNNQEVYISGYVIPLDALGFSYALSRNSYASCFFCGQAGPETVMDLMIKPKSIPPGKQNNTLLKFKGTLILKKINKHGFNYQLINAILIN